MKLLGIAMLGIISAAIAGCGTTHNNRYYDTAYAHESVSHTPGYGEQAYYDANGDVVYVHPAYGIAAPNPPDRVMYDGYYYYRG